MKTTERNNILERQYDMVEKLVERMQREFRVKDREDLYQEAIMITLESIEEYEQEDNPTYSVDDYIYAMVKGRLAEIILENYKTDYRPLPKQVVDKTGTKGFDLDYKFEIQLKDTLKHSPIGGEEELVEAFMKVMFQGYTYRELSEEIQAPYSSIVEGIEMAKDYLRTKVYKTAF